MRGNLLIYPFSLNKKLYNCFSEHFRSYKLPLFCSLKQFLTTFILVINLFYCIFLCQQNFLKVTYLPWVFLLFFVSSFSVSVFAESENQSTASEIHMETQVKKIKSIQNKPTSPSTGIGNISSLRRKNIKNNLNSPLKLKKYSLDTLQEIVKYLPTINEIRQNYFLVSFHKYSLRVWIRNVLYRKVKKII